MLKKKIVILLIGIFFFWLFIMPNIVSEAIVIACKSFSRNSNYEISISKPNIRFSIIPICSIKLDSISFKTKSAFSKIDAKNLQISFRLLPLLSGQFHVNKLGIENIFLSTNIKDEIELKKDFFEKFENRRFRLDKINIGEFKAEFYQNDIKTPIIYEGKEFI